MDAVVLTHEDVKRRDPKFFRKLARIRKGRGKTINGLIPERDLTEHETMVGAIEALGYHFIAPVEDAIKDALLEKTGYEVPEPLAPSPIHGMRDLEQLSIEAAHEMVRKPKIEMGKHHVEKILDEGVELDATAMPYVPETSPALDCCSIYHAINANNISAEAEIMRQWKESERAKADIERAEAEIKRADEAINQGLDTIARRKRIKQNLPEHKRKPTNGVEEEITRQNELRAKGSSENLEQIQNAIEERDKSDEDRAVGPLRLAEDAIVVDTTDLSIEEVVEKLLRFVEENG